MRRRCCLRSVSTAMSVLSSRRAPLRTRTSRRIRCRRCSADRAARSSDAACHRGRRHAVRLRARTCPCRESGCATDPWDAPRSRDRRRHAGQARSRPPASAPDRRPASRHWRQQRSEAADAAVAAGGAAVAVAAVAGESSRRAHAETCSIATHEAAERGQAERHGAHSTRDATNALAVRGLQSGPGMNLPACHMSVVHDTRATPTVSSPCHLQFPACSRRSR